jgi:threonine dehydrogenase-like Zn-dependent dehydrogenase
MRRAQWTEAGIEIVDADPGPLAPGWARLRVRACGICGSDLHSLRRELPAEPGTVPGHEICGELAEGPQGLREGRYAVEPHTWCGRCPECTTGRHHLCRAGRIIGYGIPGGMADVVDVPAACLHRVDDRVDPRVASLAEPLAVAVRGVHLAALDRTSRVLVLGAGTIGLLSGLAARDTAHEVAITARHPHQREAAERLGLIALGESQVEDWARQAEPDAVIETVGGHASTLDDSIRLCASSGRVVVVGVFSGPTPIDALTLMMKEIVVVGSNTYGTVRRGSEFGATVDLLPRYAAELRPLVTHVVPLDRIDEGFALAQDKRSGAIKVVLAP